MKMNIINKKNRHHLFQRTIDLWGIEDQVLTAAEECCELAQACIQVVTRPNFEEKFEHLCEEYADVTIMMEQLRYIFCKNLRLQEEWDKKVGHYIQFKLHRLVKRLDKTEERLKEEADERHDTNPSAR